MTGSRTAEPKPQETATAAEALPPHVQLIQMSTGFWVSRIVYAAARLDLADRLAEGPKSAAELAGPTGTHAVEANPVQA